MLTNLVSHAQSLANLIGNTQATDRLQAITPVTVYTQPEDSSGKVVKLIFELSLVYGGAFCLARLNQLVPQFAKRQNVLALIPALLVSSSVVLGVDRYARHLIQPPSQKSKSASASKSESGSGSEPESAPSPEPLSTSSQSSSSSSSSSPLDREQREPDLAESGASVGPDHLPVDDVQLASNTVAEVSNPAITYPLSSMEESEESSDEGDDYCLVKGGDYYHASGGGVYNFARKEGGASKFRAPITGSGQTPAVTSMYFGVRKEEDGTLLGSITGAAQDLCKRIFKPSRQQEDQSASGGDYALVMGNADKQRMYGNQKAAQGVSSVEHGQLDIPAELLVHIFRYLTPSERTRAGMTCKSWRVWALDPFTAGLHKEEVQRLFHTKLYPRRPLLVHESRWKLNLKGFNPGFPTCDYEGRWNTPGLKPLGEGCFPPTIELGGVTHVLLPTLQKSRSGYDYQLINGATGEIVSRFKGHGGMPIAYDAKRHSGLWYLAASSTTPSVKFFVIEPDGKARQVQGVRFEKSRPAITVVRLASLPTQSGSQLVGIMADEQGNLATWVVGQESKAGAKGLKVHNTRINAMLVLGNLVVSGDDRGNIVVCRVRADGSLNRLDGMRFQRERGRLVGDGGVASFSATGANTFVAGFEYGKLVGFEVDVNEETIYCTGHFSADDSGRPARSIMVHPLSTDESLLITTTGQPLQIEGDMYTVLRADGKESSPDPRYSLNYLLLSNTENGGAQISQWGSDTMVEQGEMAVDAEYCAWARPVFVNGHPVAMVMLASPGGEEWLLVTKPLEPGSHEA